MNERLFVTDSTGNTEISCSMVDPVKDYSNMRAEIGDNERTYTLLHHIDERMKDAASNKQWDHWGVLASMYRTFSDETRIR